ncbi:MAG: hypothetical protein V1714_01610 [Pseudomonadota bacterium]
MIDNTKKRKPRIRKIEEAKMIVLNTLGHSPNSIANIIGRNPQTVRIHLGKAMSLADPEVKTLVEAILAHEQKDLALLCEKSRVELHKKLDSGDLKPIELIACMDRSFQQRRLLEGLSTANVGIVAKIAELDSEMDQLRAELKAMDEAEPV